MPIALSSGPTPCCNMSSTFSTSRTTLVWITDALDREWYPIESSCRRCVKALRSVTARSRTVLKKSVTHATLVG